MKTNLLRICFLAILCLSATTYQVAFAVVQSPTSGPPAVVSPTSGPPDSGLTDGSSGAGLQNPLKADSFEELLHDILSAVVKIGAILLTVMIIYVGFLFVAAQGNEEKIKSARSALMWTIIGGLILLGAEAISLVIESTVKTL